MKNGFFTTPLQNRSPNPEDLDVYREQLDAFRRKFGREMGPDDPFFFDPDISTPQFRSPCDAARAIDLLAELMAQASVEPSAIYAFKRTNGIFPTSAGLRLDELAEWNAAIREYNDQLARVRRRQ